MGVSHALVSPDGTRRFGLDVVEQYWDFVAEREQPYVEVRDIDETFAERNRRFHREWIDEHGTAMLSEKIDLIKDGLVYPEDRYPDRRFPTEYERPVYDERDLCLLADLYTEARQEYKRREGPGESYDYLFDVRWNALVEFALVNGYGIEKR